MTEPARHDFKLDMLDDDDPENIFLYNSATPEKRYPCVSLLDISGEEVDTVDEAVGGVVRLGEANFTTFTFPNRWPA